MIPRLSVARITAVGLLAALACAAPEPQVPPGTASDAPLASPPLDTVAVLAAAREVIDSAHYATLVTLGPSGHPQARSVDPFPPEPDFTIYAATNAQTRKAAELAADPRITLLYFDRQGGSYVTVVGRAELVRDSASRARYWKEEWATFYQDRNLGDDYLLIRVTPLRLEISSERHGIRNDAVTWRPVLVELP
jgi:general stress protein 26